MAQEYVSSAGLSSDGAGLPLQSESGAALAVQWLSTGPALTQICRWVSSQRPRWHPASQEQDPPLKATAKISTDPTVAVRNRSTSPQTHGQQETERRILPPLPPLTRRPPTPKSKRKKQ